MARSGHALSEPRTYVGVMRLRNRAPGESLRDLPLFADCTDEEIAEIASLGEEVTVAAGHELTHEGHHGGLFIVILHGAAEVRVGGEVVRRLGTGDFIGEIALMMGGRSSATVVATSPLRALILSDPDFRDVLSRSPQMQAKVESTAFDRLLPDED